MRSLYESIIIVPVVLSFFLPSTDLLTDPWVEAWIFFLSGQKINRNKKFKCLAHYFLVCDW